jgi:glycosyltransferase involved in cell wall biosynthesis
MITDNGVTARPVWRRPVSSPETAAGPVDTLGAVRVLVFIPAFNEQESLADVIDGVRRELPSADVLVVSDGSTDHTVEVARAAGALVAPLPFNQGLGAALQTGYRYGLRCGYDYCAHLDADGQHRPEDLARLVGTVASGDYGLAIGSRYVMPSSAELIEDAYRASPSRRIGIVLFRALLSFTSRHRFTDTTSGFRAADRRVMTLFANSYAPDFHELESLQRAVRQGVKIAEIPVTMLPRAAGKTKITPLKSAFFVFKGLMVLGIGSFRSRHTEAPALGGLSEARR